MKLDRCHSQTEWSVYFRYHHSRNLSGYISPLLKDIISLRLLSAIFISRYSLGHLIIGSSDTVANTCLFRWKNHEPNILIFFWEQSIQHTHTALGLLKTILNFFCLSGFYFWLFNNICSTLSSPLHFPRVAKKLKSPKGKSHLIKFQIMSQIPSETSYRYSVRKRRHVY